MYIDVKMLRVETARTLSFCSKTVQHREHEYEYFIDQNTIHIVGHDQNETLQTIYSQKR